jgi:hypothetical protein
MSAAHRRPKLRHSLLLLLVLLLTACTQAALHRPENIVEQPGFTLTFLEFDDQGEPWAPEQLERTIQVIDEVHNTGKRAVVMLFVHGWHNDASQRNERKRDNNVEGFQRLLGTTREVIDQDAEGGQDVALVGVYLSWRGRSTDNSLLKPLTFYSRRGAGQRAASVSTTEAILRVMNAAKQNPESTGIVIGHSFGGMIVERALAQAVVGYTLQDESDFRPMADMIILVNPASQSMQAKNLVSMLQRNRLKFYREDAEGNRRESPLIVSVTSTADTATGMLYPLALSMKAWSKKFREYEATDCSPTKTQKPYYTQTAGHNRALHSHVITTTGDRESTGRDYAAMELEISVDPKTGERLYAFPGQDHLFTIQRLPGVFNNSPYWIMSAPPELIRDHSDIFTFNTIQMIRALFILSGAEDSSQRTLIVREDGVRPWELIDLPGGDLVFLESSRRFFSLTRDSSQPFGLACLPSIIQPGMVKGVLYQGERAIVIVSAEVQDGNKGKIENYVLAFDFGLVGSKGLVWKEIHSDLLFDGATGDLDKEVAYLARAGELYAVDMSVKKPTPVLLSRFDESIALDEMQFDSEGNRIVAADTDTNSLYLIDLSLDSPVPERVASDIGAITEIDISETESSVLLLDTVGKRLLTLDCPRDAVSCSAPEVLAAIPEFQRPIALARGDDGTVWVGDLDAQKIFTFDQTGRLVKVLDSMSGYAEP